MAELLLDKETINHDDLVSLIGARPFKAHKTYLEFISANELAKKKAAEEEKAAAGAAEEGSSAEAVDGEGGGDEEEEEGSRTAASREA